MHNFKIGDIIFVKFDTCNKNFQCHYLQYFIKLYTDTHLLLERKFEDSNSYTCWYKIEDYEISECFKIVDTKDKLWFKDCYILE